MQDRERCMECSRGQCDIAKLVAECPEGGRNSVILIIIVVQIISSLHRRFTTSYTPVLVSSLATALSTPSRATLAAMAPEQREKEDSSRVSRQRPLLRVCSELAMVGVIKDGDGRSGGEWIMKSLKELVSWIPHF